MSTVTRGITGSMCVFVFWMSIAAHAAAPVITNFVMYCGVIPCFSVQSDIGITNQIQYCTNLSQHNWLALTNFCVAHSPYSFMDLTPSLPGRFYRVLAIPSGPPLDRK